MLEDFIEVQKLNSKVIDSDTEIRKVSELIELTGLTIEQCFKTKVFLDESGNAWIIVFPWTKKLKEEKVRHAVPIFGYFIEGIEVEEVTGYVEGLVPPISVCGARILIDNSFKKFDKICTVAGKSTQALVIELNELRELVDEIVFAGLG
jgi:prolyl-tRNA editing enzyme YbaK/EbsC (Cys-tRNA(Pro) deacylase)